MLPFCNRSDNAAEPFVLAFECEFAILASLHLFFLWVQDF